MKLEEVRQQTIDETLKEWRASKRRMGCVSATEWFCKRHREFRSKRTRYYLPNGNDQNGEFWEHVVATDGVIEIDLAPYANRPK